MKNRTITGLIVALIVSLSLLHLMPLRAQVSAEVGNASAVSVDRGLGVQRQASVHSRLGFKFHVEAFDRDRHLAWTRDTHNMVTTQGANLYINSTLLNGVPVSAEADGNTAGSATAVTGTLLQDQAATGQTSLIVPGTVSFTIASYTGTFTDNGKGGMICTGTCTNFTASTSTFTYTTGAFLLSFTSGGPNANAITAAYNYIASKMYVSLFYGASAPTFAITDTLASNGWTGSAEVTSTQVTNATRPQFVGGAVSSGSTTNSGSVAVFTGNATVTLQGILVTNSNVLAGTTYGQLLGEATFTAAPIAAGYTINVTGTVTSTAG